MWQKIDLVALLVMTVLLIIIAAEFKAIAKYIFAA
jgi:hypothetical protein